ncbi:hypothetical protein [Rossellomorea aquimaris]|uniref:Uncharacterized protein n=1 Tax=Rossellomorea aquimaris TaxID=189382 RepID=A0A1J6WSK4_9BACI|nr:hypothetical protein [Rossellomorea aquimaris]OIU71203.1 hypothetical protein BHE18_09180 [Rossellomorea aquimaris]
MKEQMLKDMEGKIAEVLESKSKIDALLDNIEEMQDENKSSLAKMEQDLKGHQEALTMALDLGEAKLIKKQIDSLQEEIELQKSVTEAIVKGKYADLEAKAEEFFKVHSSACFMFKAVDDYLVVNTTLSELNEVKGIMQSYSNTLSITFAGVRAILLDTGIVALENQYKVYRGTHLGKRDVVSELNEFEYQIRPYMNKLRSYGFEIK